MSLKTGDKVRLVEAFHGFVPAGTEGTVVMVANEDGSHVFVDTPGFPDFLGVGWPLTSDEVEKIEVMA